jgi:HEAT repeat protein
MSAVLLLLSGALLSAQPPATNGPKLSGRLFHEWLADLEQEDVLVREEAIEVLGSAGPAAREAVPALEKLLKAEPWTLRTRAGVALWRITGRTEPAVNAIAAALRADSGPYARTQLLLTLQAMGTGAAPAAAAVFELVDDPDVPLRAQARHFFVYGGKSVVPLVLERLEDKDVQQRRRAAHIVEHTGHLLRDAVPAIEKHLGDDDRLVRLACARGLWSAHIQSPAAVKVLAEAVRTGSPAEQHEVLDLLPMAPLDRARREAARPILEAGLKVADLGLRLRAASALASPDAKGDDLLPVFLEGLKSPARVHWGPAATGVSRLGPGGAPALPALIALVKDRQPGPMAELGEAFAQIGPAAVGPLVDLLQASRAMPQQVFAISSYLQRLGDAAATRMLPLLEEKDVALRRAACQVLGSAPAVAAKNVAKLADCVRDNDRGVQIAALSACLTLGPNAEGAVPAILDTYKTASAELQAFRLQALEQIGGDRQGMMAAALEGLKSPSPAVRCAALSLLARIDPRHPELLPQAEKLLRESTTRSQVLPVIQRLGARVDKLAPALIELLRTERTQMARHQLVPVLGALGRSARDAAPLLVELLKEKDTHLQQISLTALLKIGGGDPKVMVPALVTFLREEQSAYFRTVAMELLGEQGPAAAEAVPLLVEELMRPGMRLQADAAAAAMVRIDPDRARKEGLPLLEKQLTGPAAIHVAGAILRLDKGHAAARAVVRRALQRTDEVRWYERYHALRALRPLGPTGKDLLPDLRPLLNDKNIDVRFEAALAVWQVGEDREAATKVFVESLDPSLPPPALIRAAATVAQMGTDGKGAIPALLKISKHLDMGIRAQVRVAVQAIDPEAARKAGLE